MLSKNVEWFDDWFAIEDIAPGVTAIGEPRFHQINWSYLITGTDRAVLFDTGCGVRDIRPVVRALTKLPVTALPSHLHFDHVGSAHLLEDMACADVPDIRQHHRDGALQHPGDRFLGEKEGMRWHPFKVSHWLHIGHSIDLGGCHWKILHTPGHAPEHISLYDAQNNILLAADFIYLGALYAQVKGANLAHYLATCETLRDLCNAETQIVAAHGQPDADNKHAAPRIRQQDLIDLADSLTTLRAAPMQPSYWHVNTRMHLLTAPHAFAAWQKDQKTI